MSATSRFREARTHCPSPRLETTDDQKDLSSDLSEDVCLPNAPALKGSDQSPVTSDQTPSLVRRISPTKPHASPLHNVKHPPAAAKPPTNSWISWTQSRSTSDLRRRLSPAIADPDRHSWWSQTGSNRRPPACKAGALPTELWPPEVRSQRSEVRTAHQRT